MKAKFNDFIKQNPHCKKFQDDEVMYAIFAFLSKDYVIINMIDAVEANKPALAPIVTNIEHFFMDTHFSTDNTLDESFTKQAVGLMIKTVLEPFGYMSSGQKNLPRNSNAEKFTSASTYRFNPLAPRTMRVVKRVEKI